MALMDIMIGFMGVVFVILGTLKIADWTGFVNAFSMYDLIAKRSRFYGYLYPLFELFIGWAFVFRFLLRPVAAFTLVLMVIGVIGVTKSLISNPKMRCACLGTIVDVPLTKFTLTEDIVMGVMAAAILILI